MIFFGNFVILKKGMAWFLAVLLVFAQTPMQQLLKLPQLYSHFLDHNHDEQHLDFVHFLKMHYSDHSPNDHDQEEDSKLPFKGQDLQIAGNFFSFADGYRYTGLSVPEVANREYHAYLVFPYSDPEQNSIFQPPREG